MMMAQDTREKRTSRTSTKRGDPPGVGEEPGDAARETLAAGRGNLTQQGKAAAKLSI